MYQVFAITNVNTWCSHNGEAATTGCCSPGPGLSQPRHRLPPSLLKVFVSPLSAPLRPRGLPNGISVVTWSRLPSHGSRRAKRACRNPLLSFQTMFWTICFTSWARAEAELERHRIVDNLQSIWQVESRTGSRGEVLSMCAKLRSGEYVSAAPDKCHGIRRIRLSVFTEH